MGWGYRCIKKLGCNGNRGCDDGVGAIVRCNEDTGCDGHAGCSQDGRCNEDLGCGGDMRCNDAEFDENGRCVCLCNEDVGCHRDTGCNGGRMPRGCGMR